MWRKRYTKHANGRQAYEAYGGKGCLPPLSPLKSASCRKNLHLCTKGSSCEYYNFLSGWKQHQKFVCEQHGRNVHQTVIWVTSDTFPQLPAAARPQSCRVLSLLADLGLCLKIDAHLQQQHGSSSARKRVNQESCGGIKSSAACFAKQRRPAYGCLVLPPQPRWEMVFVRVIKLSHNPITSVIFMIQPRDWTQSLCLTRQLDKC